jgi:hypothetical protein
MEQLIQALTAYTSTLEQQLAALEARVALLETESGKLKTENEALEAQIATLRAEVTSLSAAGVAVTPAEEPEVEIELIIEEDSETENGEVKTENELVEEPQQEIQEELATLDIVDAPETEEPIVEAPTIEPESMVEPIVEPALTPEPEIKVEPVVVPQPAPRPMPTQTSLFGSAVEDIRQAISLGDRFLFQRELFAGNGELMQKTLDELNALGSLNEAMDYVLNNFEWDKESTAVQLFENVLKRRFS